MKVAQVGSGRPSVGCRPDPIWATFIQGSLSYTCGSDIACSVTNVVRRLMYYSSYKMWDETPRNGADRLSQLVVKHPHNSGSSRGWTSTHTDSGQKTRTEWAAEIPVYL